MAASGYEFTLRGARAGMWVLFGLAIGAIGLGALGIFASEIFELLRPRDATIAGAVGVAGGGYALLRALIQAHDCRIGDAGLLFRTLPRNETFVPWSSFLGARVSSRTLRIFFRDEGGRRAREVWVWTGGASSSERLRLRTFLEDRARAQQLPAPAVATTPTA